MDNSLKFIAEKYNLNLEQRHQPLEIPNTTRDTFAVLLAEMGFNLGVEMGVERGLYSEVLLKANPNLKLSCVDAWTAYDNYRDHVSQEELDAIQADATKRLAPFNAVLIKGYSMDVVKGFTDESLDFVYIDGNHEFQQTVNDICEWQKKVKVGGIVAGHDYIKRTSPGYLMHVPMAIHGYVESYNISPLFVLGRKDADTNTNPAKGELRESTRSWFYVKPAPPVLKPGHKMHS